MKTLVVYCRGSTQRPRSVLASLSKWLRDTGHDVFVADVSDFSFVNQDLPPRWFVKLAGHDVYPSKLLEVLSTLGVTYMKLSKPTTRSLPLPKSVENELEDAIRSDLVTYFNSDQVDTSGGLARWVHKQMYEASGPLYVTLGSLLEASPFDLIYVPNGRVPEHRMALEAAKKFGVAVRFYEIGRAKPQSFYAGVSQVHDRLGSQNEVDIVLSGAPQHQITSMAHDWLAERTARNSTLNVYSVGWEGVKSRDTRNSGREKAVFFSSSVDEFASYGEAWKMHSWVDQYEAFDRIIGLLESKGVYCQLRIHPNLANKSRSYFLREISRIAQVQAAHPNLHVVWHNEAVNSYELVRESDYIVVGRSTLGLEASLMGKCVWTTTAARYDKIADIRTALSSDEVTHSNFTLWEVDPRGAERFVAYWAVQDHEFFFGEEAWSTWDSFRAPEFLRIGQLLVSNRVRHKIHLVTMELTRRRNLRFNRVPNRKRKT